MDIESPSAAVPILILLVVAGFGIHSGVTSYLQYHSPTAEVQGEVLSADVDESNSRRGGVDHYISIEYQYQYNGTQYTSESVTPGSGESSVGESTAEAFVANHSAGESVTVYVNTNAPSQSWVINQRPLGSILVGGTISLAALVILYGRYVRGWKQNSN